MHQSGVHATIAGVALALLTPIEPHMGHGELEKSALDLVVDFRSGRREGTREGGELSKAALRDLERLTRESQSVLDRLEHALHPWTSYVIVPIFALANAGIVIDSTVVRDAASSPISIGVAVGLMLGKPIGITLFSYLAVRLGLASLPGEVRWRQLGAVSMVAGIGFTVSLFVTGLAFTDISHIDDAKLGILVGSTLIGVAGLVLLRTQLDRGGIDASTVT